MDRISILACECQPIMIEGLQRVLETRLDMELTGLAARLGDAIEQLQARQPDVFLVDHAPGIGAILRLVASLKGASVRSHPVLWVSEISEAEALRALQLGVRGILRRDVSRGKLIECLQEVGRGRIWVENSAQVAGIVHRRETSRLTAREKDVVRLVCRGMKNKEIAGILGITAGTVKVHLMHIFEKTGLKDRFALAVEGRTLPGMAAEEKESPAGLKVAPDGVDQVP